MICTGLALNKYFEDPAFINYLRYLDYWRQTQYVTYIRCEGPHVAPQTPVAALVDGGSSSSSKMSSSSSSSSCTSNW
jgi:hypothetical protein